MDPSLDPPEGTSQPNAISGTWPPGVRWESPYCFKPLVCAAAMAAQVETRELVKEPKEAPCSVSGSPGGNGTSISQPHLERTFCTPQGVASGLWHAHLLL